MKGKGDSREARKASADREGGGARLISPIPLPLLAPATQATKINTLSQHDYWAFWRKSGENLKTQNRSFNALN